MANREAEDDFDVNSYTTSKSVSQEMLNTSSIQYQIGLLISMFATRDNTIGLSGFETTLLVFVAISLTSQFIMFVLLVLLAKTTTTMHVTRKCSVTSINNWVTTLSGLSLIINIIITMLAIEMQKEKIK